jgi:hypothetical protein
MSLARAVPAIATRHEKTVRNFLAAVQFVVSFVWLIDDKP